MSDSVADFVLKRLREWGVHRIYGYPGDGINGFLGAFERVDGDPEFIQTRHEEMAAFMAGAHAKFTGEIGCCIATSGPGAIHLLNGLYDAKLDHQPVLAIIGQQKRISMGAHYQQEVDLQVLFKDVSIFCNTCADAAQARHLMSYAFAADITRRARRAGTRPARAAVALARAGERARGLRERRRGVSATPSARSAGRG